MLHYRDFYYGDTIMGTPRKDEKKNDNQESETETEA